MHLDTISESRFRAIQAGRHIDCPSCRSWPPDVRTLYTGKSPGTTWYDDDGIHTFVRCGFPPPPSLPVIMPSASDFSLGKVDVSLTPRERFEEFLQARGKRVTRQRQMIVEHVSSRHEHFDADQLLADLRKTPEGAAASRPTVYRTLAELVDAGLLRKMVLGGRAVYEHDYGYPQHDHLHCTGCQTLIEFSSADLGKILDAVAALHQFRAQGHRLIISGLCMNCRTNRSRSRHQDRI